MRPFLLDNMRFAIKHNLTVKTNRGRAVRIRPIRAADASLLLEFYARLSPDTRRLRFMHSLGDIPPDVLEHEARRMADIDHTRQVALLATVREDGREQIVGVARLYELTATSDAEIAFVVRDDYQNEGLGRTLFTQVVEMARQRGITRLHASMLAENRAMYHLIESSGLPFASSMTRGEMTLLIEL